MIFLLIYYHQKKMVFKFKRNTGLFGMFSIIISIFSIMFEGQGSKSDLWPEAWVHSPVVKGRLAFA